jgi:hypothetical protein
MSDWLECRYDEAAQQIWVRSPQRARTNLRAVLLGASLAGGLAGLGVLALVNQRLSVLQEIELFALTWVLLTLLITGCFVALALRAQARFVELRCDLTQRCYRFLCSSWRRDDIRTGSLDELADVSLTSEEVRDGVAPPFRQLFIRLRWRDPSRPPVGPLVERRTNSGRAIEDHDPLHFARELAAALRVPLDDQSSKQQRSPSMKLPPVAALDSL